MIIQVSKEENSARLEILGLEISDSEKELLLIVITWTLAFLTCCRVLELKDDEDCNTFVDSIRGLLNILMHGSNRIFESLMDSSEE